MPNVANVNRLYNPKKRTQSGVSMNQFINLESPRTIRQKQTPLQFLQAKLRFHKINVGKIIDDQQPKAP